MTEVAILCVPNAGCVYPAEIARGMVVRKLKEVGMEAILEIRGWRKKAEVSYDAPMRGWVRIAIDPPLDILFRPDEKVMNGNITAVDLFYKGVIGQTPFFKAE
jgi:hypothetical protein